MSRQIPRARARSLSSREQKSVPASPRVQQARSEPVGSHPAEDGQRFQLLARSPSPALARTQAVIQDGIGTEQLSPKLPAFRAEGTAGAVRLVADGAELAPKLRPPYPRLGLTRLPPFPS